VSTQLLLLCHAEQGWRKRGKAFLADFLHRDFLDE
jgi:hypothetical protein